MTTRSSGFVRKRVAQRVGGVDGPQVLVLDVDEAARPVERLQVRAAMLRSPFGRERIRAVGGPDTCAAPARRAVRRCAGRGV